MSRTFKFHAGSRDPNDEDRLIKAVMRQAQPGDTVEVDLTAAPKSPKNPAKTTDRAIAQPTRPDDEAAERLAGGLNASLERENDKADQTAQGKPLKTPEEQAKETAAAIRSVKSWRDMINEAGWKVVVEIVFKSAWADREQLWNDIKVLAKDTIEKITG